MTEYIPLSAIDVNYEIINKEDNCIHVRAYSSLYKNPISSYPIYNIDLTFFDFTRDPRLELAAKIQDIVYLTVNKEHLQGMQDFDDFINDNFNKTFTATAQEIEAHVKYEKEMAPYSGDFLDPNQVLAAQDLIISDENINFVT